MITKQNEWFRECPKCKTNIRYSQYENFRRAIRKNSVCKGCCDNRGKFNKKNTNTYWTSKEAFIINSTCTSSVLRRLFRKESTYQCECGNNGMWRGKSLVLHLDHINGNRKDNRKTNLRWLCPNCHQQTETWGRGIK